MGVFHPLWKRLPSPRLRLSDHSSATGIGRVPKHSFARQYRIEAVPMYATVPVSKHSSCFGSITHAALCLRFQGSRQTGPRLLRQDLYPQTSLTSRPASLNRSICHSAAPSLHGFISLCQLLKLKLTIRVFIHYAPQASPCKKHQKGLVRASFVQAERASR